MLQKPHGTISVRLGPAPENIWRHHAEILNGRAEIVRARSIGTLFCRSCATAHREQKQKSDGETTYTSEAG